jgi:hypothetical protein
VLERYKQRHETIEPWMESRNSGVAAIYGSKLDLQIGRAKVEFRTVNGRHPGKLRVVVLYADASRYYLGEKWKTMDMQLQQET